MKKLLKPEEISLFCTQIVYMLRVGATVADGVALICEDRDSGALGEVFAAINKETEQGSPLSDAMQQTGAFPDYVVGMVTIGETSGKTEEVLRILAEYYDQEKALKQKLYMAVFNPILLFVMMSAVVLLLVTKVMPMFVTMFGRLGGQVSAQADAAVKAGVAVCMIALIIIILVTIILIIGVLMFKTQRGHFYMDTLISKFPLTKKLTAKIAARNFARAMHLMLSSGMEINDSLRLSADIVNNSYLKQKIFNSLEKTEKGEPFTEVLAKAGIFSSLFTSVLSVGFKTGSMEDVMKKLSDVYDEEVNVALNNLANIVEPVLVGILAVVIGSVIIAVMLPLAGIMSTLG